MNQKHLGYNERELNDSPYAAFYRPDIGPFQEHVAEALLIGGQAPELLPPATEAAQMLEPGYGPVETGYTRATDRSIRVFCLTRMPRVSPQMWDWWFGWHGCEAQRYKLWHPKAHVAARWSDGLVDERYVGRTSLITEYIGSKLANAGIRFVAPSAIGLDEQRLAAQGEVAICARVCIPGTPVEGGWLLHQLRPVEGGSEMRSRMWLGGENATMGDNPGGMSRTVMRLLRPLTQLLLPDPAELLTHNAQEMAHLAGFLPELYAAFGPEQGPESP